MTQTISIIIPVYNRLNITKNGLYYLIRAVDFFKKNDENKFNVKIVIVDDGSTDGTPEYIKSNHPDVVVLSGDGNMWWTGAVNYGINYVINNIPNNKGIILQNDDIVIDEDWLYELLKAVKLNPNKLIGCATSTLEMKDQILYGGRNINSWFATEKLINFGNNRSNFPKGYLATSFDLYGRGLYIPMDVFEKIGLFNQQQFKHRGDMDIPLRAKKAGFKLLVCYDALVYELPQATYGLDIKKKISLAEGYKQLTDFRSSNNLKFIYYYSLNATNNPVQFTVFYISNLFYNLRRVCWRVLSYYIF